MSKDPKPDAKFSWPKEVSFSLAVGMLLGYPIGWFDYDASAGFLGGVIIALVFFSVRFLHARSTIPALIMLALGTVLYVALTPAIADAPSYQALRIVPPQIDRHLRMWQFGAQFHRIAYFVLASIAGVFSILVAVDVPRFKKYRRWLALVAAIAFGLISSFDLGDKANRYKNGWRLLNAAAMRYELDSTFTVTQLIDAYYKGEQTIGDVKPDPR